MSQLTKADFDQADALLDAARLRVAGDVTGAGMTAIPAVRVDPIQAAAFLISLVATAVHAYGHATGQHPVAAFDDLWCKPVRDGGGDVQ